jgi:hypothetical protein
LSNDAPQSGEDHSAVVIAAFAARDKKIERVDLVVAAFECGRTQP